MVCQRADFAPGGQKPPGDVLASVAECAGDDIEPGCFDHGDILHFFGVSPDDRLGAAPLWIGLTGSLHSGAPRNVPAQDHAHDHYGNDEPDDGRFELVTDCKNLRLTS